MLSEYGPARLQVVSPSAKSVVMMRVLRAELGIDLVSAKAALRRVLSGDYSGTRAIHRLVRDEEVAAQVTTDFLRRPAVASQVRAEDKVRVVEEFTRDDDVATEVTTNILRRPTVARRAMADDTTRFLVNEAQHHNDEESREAFHRDAPVAPTIRRLERSIEFIELVGAFHALVTTAGRIVPRLRDRTLSDEERAVIHENVARVKATLEWVEHAVDTGEVDLETELERLIRGE